MAGVLIVCLLRLADISGLGLDLAQFLVTVALLAALPPWASPCPRHRRERTTTPGRRPHPAARRPGTERALRYVLLTGSQKAFAHGMRAFMLRHGGGLDRERTIVLNLDTVGHGLPRYRRREGPGKAVRSHFQLVELCAGGRGFRRGGPRLGRAAGTDRRLRRPDGGSGGRDHHLPRRTRLRLEAPDRAILTWSEAFCPIIRRLDAEVSEDP